MAQAVEFYRCELCGNIIALVNNGGGTALTCCGQEMTHLVAGYTDAAKEKHVPAVVKEDGKIKVTVGSVTHPMEEKHYIQWVYLLTEQGGERKILNPGDAPEAVFALTPGDKFIAAYEYCNLHGLWKA